MILEPRRKNDFIFATQKRARSQCLDAGGHNDDVGQVAAPAERKCADFRDAVGNGDAGQAAPKERIRADCRDSMRKDDF